MVRLDYLSFELVCIKLEGEIWFEPTFDWITFDSMAFLSLWRMKHEVFCFPQVMISWSS